MTLYGAGIPEFSRALEGLRQIYLFIGQQFGENDIRPLLRPQYAEQPALTASSRYMSPVLDQKWGTAAVPSAMDPFGVIAHAVVNGNFCFTTDNVVDYHEVSRDANGK